MQLDLATAISESRLSFINRIRSQAAFVIRRPARVFALGRLRAVPYLN